MSWSERLRTSWKTFVKIAFPLYLWYIIFFVASLVIFFATVFGTVMNLRGIFNGFSGYPYGGFSGVPGYGPFGGFNGYPPYGLFPAIGHLVGSFFLITIIFILAFSIFTAGHFNLTKKGLRAKPAFGDFKFNGFLRVLAWQAILLLGLLLIGIVITVIVLIWSLIFRSFPVILILGAIVLFLSMAVLFIYVYPWLYSTLYYLLAHREFPFGEALRKSWGFFRKHMRALWDYIGLILLIQVSLTIAIFILGKMMNSLGSIAFLAGFLYFVLILGNVIILNPFLKTTAIVWVLTLDEDSGPAPNPSNPDPSLQPVPGQGPSPQPNPASASDPTLIHSDLDSALNSDPVPDSHPDPGLVPNEPIQSEINFCPYCGQKVSPDSPFCSNCGKKISKEL